MKIHLLSWNVNEANNCDKRKVIKALIKKNRVDLVCLQETKWMKYKHTQNLGWRLNGEKLTEQTI